MEEEMKDYLRTQKKDPIYYVFLAILIAVVFMENYYFVDAFPYASLAVVLLFGLFAIADQSWEAYKHRTFMIWLLYYKDKIEFYDFLLLNLDFKWERKRRFRNLGIEPFELDHEERLKRP